MRLSVLSTLEPMVRDVTALALSDSCATLIVELDSEGTTLHLDLADGATKIVRVPLSHSCISCSLRHAVIPFLEQWADRLDEVLLALPPTIESIDVVPSFIETIEENPLLDGSTVTSVVTSINLGEVAEELLTHVSLSERDLAVSEEDDRCAGEVLAMNVGHADVIVALGESQLGLELVEHLRPHDAILIPGLENLTAEMVFSGHHDTISAIERVHPVTTMAWGGPTDNGVWTLDLSSTKPFHPERLQESIALLSPEGVCVRGCFWLPSRPNLICTWNSHGGSVTVGTAGEWDGDQMTHLIITGVGDHQENIERVFRDALLEESAAESVLDWVGVSDGLDHWFLD